MSDLARFGGFLWLGVALWLGCGLLACGPGSESDRSDAPAPPPAAGTEATTPAGGEPSVAASEEAEQIFATRCFTCHGPAGAGDGPGSAGLTPAPRDLQDPAWQQSVSDEHIEQIIQYGGSAVGRSPAMPGNPDLMSKPEIVAALRAHIRGLAPR